MRLKRALLPLLLLPALALFACTQGRSTDLPLTPTSTAALPTASTATATAPVTAATPSPGATRPAGGATPSANATGIASVDGALRAVLAGDVAGMAAQSAFSMEACTTAQGAGGPPKCRAGEPSGTLVEVLAAASCEGYYLRRDELTATLTRFLEGDVELYGVYRHGGRFFIPGRYVIVVSHTDPRISGPQGRQLFIDDGGITGLNFGCGQSPAQIVESQALTGRLGR